MAPVLRSEDRIDHPPGSVPRCRELIAVAVSQIDGDPIVGDRLVDPALEITVAHFKKIIALQRAGRRNPMAHENAEDLTANVLVGRSVRHRSTIGFARHRSYGRTATVDKIAQPMGDLAYCRACPLSGVKRTWLPQCKKSANDPKRASHDGPSTIVAYVRGYGCCHACRDTSDFSINLFLRALKQSAASTATASSTEQ